MTANAGENSNRESEVGRLAHYCVRRGVPNLQCGRNINQRHGAMSMAPVLVLFMNEFMYLVTHGCCSDCEDVIEPHHDRFTALHPKLFADVLGVVRVWFRFGCLVGKNVS